MTSKYCKGVIYEITDDTELKRALEAKEVEEVKEPEKPKKPKKEPK